MQRPHAPISLADLSAAGVQLRPYEAVTIVRELLLQVTRGDVAGVPSAHVIRLSSTGLVSVEGPVAAGGRPVLRAAQLLDSLLPVSDARPQFRVPGGLKLLVARALGTLDLPPFPSLESFVEALARFGAGDPVEIISNLVNSAGEIVVARPQHVVEVEPFPSAQVQPFVSARMHDVHGHMSREPLTVSDIRRARRATGLPLAVIAERSHIPIGMLRQLEWGYFVNWPTGHYARVQLVRYARASGLDEQLVVASLLPQIEQAERPALVPVRSAASTPARVETPAVARVEPPAEVVDGGAPAAALVPRTGIEWTTDLEPAGATVLHRTVVQAHSRRRWRAAALAALAIPALLAIGLLPAWRDEASILWSTPGLLTAAIGTLRPAESPAPSEQRPGPVESSAPIPGRTEAAETSSTPQPRAATGAAQPAQAPAPERPAPSPADLAAYTLASDRAFSPSSASAGTARFYDTKATAGDSSERAEGDGDGSVLQVTRIVDDTANNLHVRVSPNGRRIAFDSDRDGMRGVYIADADGQHVKRVSGDGWAAVPSWSPDSGTIAFVRAEPELPGVWNLWTLELSTGETRRITRHKSGQPWGGSWFPDGRHIAYNHESRLVIRDLQDGTERGFDSPIKGRRIKMPAVSPDGRRVVFQVDRSGTWLLELPAGSMRRILEDPTAEEYTWSPDGRRLAYHSRRSDAWGVWVMGPR